MGSQAIWRSLFPTGFAARRGGADGHRSPHFSITGTDAEVAERSEDLGVLPKSDRGGRRKKLAPRPRPAISHAPRSRGDHHQGGIPMSQDPSSTSNAQNQNTVPPAALGEHQRGLVGAISADQVTNIQIGTSSNGPVVQPAAGGDTPKE